MPDSVAAGLRLAPEELTRPFAPEQFTFDTTDDLEPFRGVLGQERAVEALQFGVAMPRPGYNVFVMGEPGTGRFSFVKRYLQAEGKRVATPSDWVYLNNFDEPREPRVIELPPGSATEFSADIDRLIDNLMSTFPAVFEHPAYQQKKNAVDRAFNQRYDRALDSVERRALEKDVALYRDSANVAFTPMKDGKALDEAEFAQLPEAERERFHKDIAALEEYLNEELASLPQWKRESSNQLRELNEETITLALQPLLAPLVEKYNNNPGVCAYLQAMQLNLSLRLRLTLILGSAFILLWSLAAAWMLCDLRGQMMRSFDQRLAASARMVAGLLQQLPQPQPADGQTTRLSAEQLGIPNGMACQVSSLRGEVLAQSHATPERALDSTASGFRDQEINGVLWRS